MGRPSSPGRGVSAGRGRRRAAWPAIAVDVGNPHAVAFVDDLDDAGTCCDQRTRVDPATCSPTA